VCLIVIVVVTQQTTTHPFNRTLNNNIMTENQLIDELNMSREEIAEREYERRHCNDEQE
jgi:hypothetical protein